jgi:hypothetical protein
MGFTLQYGTLQPNVIPESGTILKMTSSTSV